MTRREIGMLAGVIVLFFHIPPMYGQTAANVDEIANSAISKQKDRPMWFHLRTVGLEVPFVYRYKATKVKFNGDGSIKNNAWWIQEVVPVNGTRFVADIDASFNPDDKIRSKIEAQHQKEFEERQIKLEKMSEGDKKKSLEAKKKREEERRQFWDEFARAFHFKRVDNSDFHGRPTTTATFTPDPAYRPHGVVDTAYFQKIQGKIWVDDAEQEIARIELEFTKDVSGGLGLLGKVYQGTRYSMELAKQYEDRWLPKRAETDLRQRILLFKEHETFTVEFGNYREFSTDVKIGSPRD
jgi:hypothetical protein